MAYAVVGHAGSCQNEPESDVRPFSAWHEFSGCVAWTRIATSRSLVEYHRRQNHSRTAPCNVSSESKLVKIDQVENNYSVSARRCHRGKTPVIKNLAVQDAHEGEAGAAYGEQPLTERLDCNARRGAHVSSRGQWLSGAERWVCILTQATVERRCYSQLFEPHPLDAQFPPPDSWLAESLPRR